jgi:hypothetical protein
MVESQRAPRLRVVKAAKIGHAGIAAKFTLVLPPKKLQLANRIVWRASYRLGVAFE